MHIYLYIYSKKLQAVEKNGHHFVNQKVNRMLLQWTWRQSMLPCSSKNLRVRITKALEATCWLKAFFAKKLIVWGHLKTTKIIHFSNGIKEWRRFSQWHGSVEENETLLTWNTVELRRKKRARHANVAFVLGAAVSRGPS